MEPLPLEHGLSADDLRARILPRLRFVLSSRKPARIPPSAAPASFRPASVLLPFYPSPDGVRLILTRRTEALPSHRGEISFPGGRREEGETPEEAALREAREEVGIEPSAVALLGELDEVWSVGGYLVRPFVGWLEEPPMLRPDPGEIAAIIEAPLHRLMDPGIHRVEQISARGRDFPVHYYDLDGEVIWGLTGGLVHRVVALLRGDERLQPANHADSLRAFLSADTRMEER